MAYGTNKADTELLLREFLEYAPRDPGKLSPDLIGWRSPDGATVCNRCAGRIMARGCRLPQNAEPIWQGQDKPVCCCCQ